MKTAFSNKEIKLLSAFNLGELLTVSYFTDNPIRLYQLAVSEAFNCPSKYSQEALESLRKCNIAIGESKIYRKTEEFDNLIDI